MGTYTYAWVAVRAPDGWLDLGVLMRRGKELRWRVADNVKPTVAQDIEDMVKTAILEGTVDDLWDYLLERGLGGLSSVSAPKKLKAERWSAAWMKAMAVPPQKQE